MLSALQVLTEQELDHLIASYGLVEELNANENYLKEIVQIARELMDSTVSYISILDSKHQRIVSMDGFAEFSANRHETICQHTVSNRSTTIIKDLKTHQATCELKKINEVYKMYAGFPLINAEGIAIGSLCVLDKESKEFDPRSIRIMELLAKEVVSKFDTRRNLISLIKEINRNFKPGECSDINCLRGELSHLHQEVVESSEQLLRQKEELDTINTKLSKFAHRIAHDLKAPLGTISSFSKLIKKQIDKQDVEYSSEYFDFVNVSVLELQRLIGNILSIAEMKSNVIREKISISEIISKIETLLANDILSKQVKIIKPDRDIQVIGYKVLLKQLFQNIISNAIKYSDKNKDPFIEISFELQEFDVYLEIKDNGIGISEEDLEDIFKPFMRASNDEEIEGLGIGLDTCRIILNDMGSDLKVKSELGKGTSFSFAIPYQ